MEWQNRAACKDTNNDLFFPVKGNLTDQQYWQASLICKECPVNVACLKFALEKNISQGLFCLPEKVRKRFKNKKLINLSKTIKETFKIIEIINPTFNNKGELIKNSKDFTKRAKGIGQRTSWCKVCLNKNLQNWHDKKNAATT